MSLTLALEEYIDLERCDKMQKKDEGKINEKFIIQILYFRIQIIIAAVVITW